MESVENKSLKKRKKYLEKNTQLLVVKKSTLSTTITCLWQTPKRAVSNEGGDEILNFDSSVGEGKYDASKLGKLRGSGSGPEKARDVHWRHR